MKLMRTSGVSAAALCAILRATSACSKVRLASTRNTDPAALNSTLRLDRLNRSTPMLISRRRIAWLNGGCAILRRAAARPKCSSSATATNCRICLKSKDQASVRTPCDIPTMDSVCVLSIKSLNGTCALPRLASATIGSAPSNS